MSAGDPALACAASEFLRRLDAAEYLPAYIHEAPVWIVPCLEGSRPTDPYIGVFDIPSGSEHAARRASTRPRSDVDDAVFAVGEGGGGRSRLAAERVSYALLPIGYPMGRFGPVRRVPLADVVYEDRWDRPYRDL